MRMRRRLGLGDVGGEAVVGQTLALLSSWPVSYGSLFWELGRFVADQGLPEEPEALVPFVAGAPSPPRDVWLAWRDSWWAEQRSATGVSERLQRWNLPRTPTRPCIDSFWDPIDQRDDWRPLNQWLLQLKALCSDMQDGCTMLHEVADDALHNSFQCSSFGSSKSIYGSL